MTEKKEAVFVICEYNPFHFGHLHQLSELKERYGSVLCVMSGDYVQRGESAIYPKQARAAAAGVYLAAALGCRHLAFGAEDGGDALLAASGVLCDRAAVADIQKQNRNLSYPKAASLLLAERLGDGFADIASKPNNILGIEYISAAKRLGCDMDFEVVRRSPAFESSSVIRNRGDVLPYIPERAARVLSGIPRRDMKRLDSALMAAALRLSAGSDVYGLDSGEVMRLKNAAEESRTADETVERAVSATMTRAKARRGMLSALLGITQGDAATKPLYTSLLALGENGASYISRHRKELCVPVATKLSHISRAGAEAVGQYERGIVAGRVAALAEENTDARNGSP